MTRASVTLTVAIVALLSAGPAFGDAPLGPGAMTDSTAAERHYEEHEIHRGRQLHWIGAGLTVAGVGLALASVPMWKAVDGCTQCAPQAQMLGMIGLVGLDGLALAAVAGGVTSWVIGTQRIDRALARRHSEMAVVPLVAPLQGGAVAGALIVF